MSIPPYYTFLIVEDEEQIRILMQEFIALSSHQTVGAQNGDEALNILSRNSIDAVVTDVQMHKMDGITLMRRIHHHHPLVPVAVMSGGLSQAEVISVIRQGAIDFLSKPFQLHQVNILVEKLIRARHQLLRYQNLKTALEKKAPPKKTESVRYEQILEVSRIYSKAEDIKTFFNFNDVIEKITIMSAEATHAEAAYIGFFDADNLPNLDFPVYFPQVSPELIETVGRKILQEQNFCVMHAESPDYYELMNTHLFRNLLAVPIIQKDKIMGFVMALNKKYSADFNDLDIFALLSLSFKITHIWEGQNYLEDTERKIISTLENMISFLESRNPYAPSHSFKVAQLACEIAKELDCTQDQIKLLELSGYLHNIGNIAIENQIFTKPYLTREEYEAVKKHPEVSELIINLLGSLFHEKAIIRHHHESWDGKGYPDGLSGESIPLLSRILSVADTYVALTSDRPQRKAFSHQEGVQTIQKLSNIKFDYKVVRAFIKIAETQNLGSLSKSPVEVFSK